MPTKQYTNEQIDFLLRQAETETRVAEICRKIGIAEPTFNRWKKKFFSMNNSEFRRLKQLEEKNKKLKQLVADVSLDKSMLHDETPMAQPPFM